MQSVKVTDQVSDKVLSVSPINVSSVIDSKTSNDEAMTIVYDNEPKNKEQTEISLIEGEIDEQLQDEPHIDKVSEVLYSSLKDSDKLRRTRQ